jgi:hypothetical protein
VVESSPLTANFRSRTQRKRLARLLSQWMDRAGPLLVRPGCKQLINRVLAVLARGQAVWGDEHSGSVTSRTSRQ